MKQRILAALLAAVLLAGLWITPAVAAGTVTVSEVSGKKGELVDVNILLTSDDVCSGNFNVRYDSDALELVSAESTDLFQCLSNPYEDGSVRVSFMRIRTITDAQLCTLIFRITADTSAEGSPIALERVKLYNENGTPVQASVIEGAVARKTARLSIRQSETAEYQSVRAIVDLGGSLRSAGGNFTVTYDPACFAVTSVLPLEAMGDASFAYHIVEPGTVRIAFSAADLLEGGALCSLVFQTVGHAGDHTELTLREVKLYDENSGPVDATVVDGSISIVVPSEDDPKLWVVGGAVQEDQTARAAVVLQGRGYACGGNFVLRYDKTMQAQISAVEECRIRHDAQNGVVYVSWASATPYSGEAELLTLTFENAVESTVEITDAAVYHDEGKPIPVVDIRHGRISKVNQVTAVVDEVVVETGASESNYTVTVDVADLNYFTEKAVERVTTALAL